VILREKSSYRKYKCSSCESILYLKKNSKGYLLEYFNERPVDMLRPMCNFCILMDMYHSNKAGHLYLYTKEEI
jgi:hypothetical protein